MTSLARMFDVLDLFSEQRPVLRADEVSRELNYTRATGYRYLKALCDAGLLTLTNDGIYMLGPRILELERLQRLTDPLLRASQDVVARIAPTMPRSSLIVCSLYRDRVLCIHQERAEHLVVKGQTVALARAKGLPFPLFAGAASLAILAFLPPYRNRALYIDKEQEIARAGLATTWPEFRARIAAIKTAGYAMTVGHLNADLAAIAAPIRTTQGQVLGSLARILLRADFVPQDEAAYAAQIKEGAMEIAMRLAQDTAPDHLRALRQPSMAETGS